MVMRGRSLHGEGEQKLIGAEACMHQALRLPESARALEREPRTERAMRVSAMPRRGFVLAAAASALAGALPGKARAELGPAFAQALAEGVAAEPGLAAFYRARGYAPVFTGPEDAERRAALVWALGRAEAHGLPARRYRLEELIAAYHQIDSERARGMVEAETARTFLRYARDISSGLTEPRRVVEAIVRELPRPDSAQLMMRFATGKPAQVLRDLIPPAPHYARLFKARLELLRVITEDGWGPPVRAESLRPGDSGPQVVALRNRLRAMGYLERNLSARYDGALQRAVQAFQEAHGLNPNGIASRATLAAVNVPPEERLKAVLVSLERERWLNISRGERHVWVNLTEFVVRLIDADAVTFETRAVIGGQMSETQTPEFSHQITYLEINPDWTMPRSILARSYWNGLVAGGHPYLQIVDASGRVVPRQAINFAAYSPRTFPYEVRQPPGPTNPLGRVKFMFPNPWSIYLHDSPQRSLFNTVVRTHSSGCVRVENAAELAHLLLARQVDDPVRFFQTIVDSGRQTRIFLEEPVPIHLDYRTALVAANGRLHFRPDVYGRDARLYEALRAQGVEDRAWTG